MATEAATRNEPTDTTPKPPNMMDFDDAKEKIHKLVDVMDEQEQFVMNNRNLRYANIDLEAERKCGRLAPDELYIPQHIIDTNIRREQARYVGYITQARRAMILHNPTDPSADNSLVEWDITNRFRYDGWQIPMFKWVDGMQQNGYGVLEMVVDATLPGHLKFQEVAYGDFGYSLDTRDIQSCEMVVRRYYFTRTQLQAMAREDTWKFNKEETKKVYDTKDTGVNDYKEQSLYKIEKVMFRKGGIIMVGWSCQQKCNDWLRAPRPLYIGRQTMDPVTRKWVKAFETRYPYFVSLYNISENTILKQARGRAYLDQDTQEAVTSLMSSMVTSHRRAAGLYFAKDSENDPNSDVLEQSNVFFKTGSLINAKVKQFQLTAPDSSMITAIQALAGMNMQENSQINFAANNRVDSRKTATEIQAAQAEAQLLSTIQLALFSTTMKDICTAFFEIVQSRILSGLIKDVLPNVIPMYGVKYQVRSSGDTDVIERQEKIARMQQTWPVVAQTPIAGMFMQKLLSLLFPDDAAGYVGKLQDDGTCKALLTSVSHVLAGIVMDPGQLTPQAQQHIPEMKQILLQVQQYLDPQQAQQSQKAMATQRPPAQPPQQQQNPSQQQPSTT